MKRLLGLGGILILLYAAVVVYVTAFQDRFLYQPQVESEATLVKIAEEHGLERIRSDSGETIGWLRPVPGAARRIVVLHGGSGYALQRAFYADALTRLGWEVALFEYPGFGARAGKPGKASFLAAGETFVQGQLVDERPLYLLGESMGSGTACALANIKSLDGRTIRGIALVVPYARMADVARRRMRGLPTTLMLRDKYDNIAALREFAGPLVVVVAERDDVVGPDQGRLVHATYTGPKHLIVLPDTHHADFAKEPEAGWWKELSNALLGSR